MIVIVRAVIVRVGDLVTLVIDMFVLVIAVGRLFSNYDSNMVIVCWTD